MRYAFVIVAVLGLVSPAHASDACRALRDLGDAIQRYDVNSTIQDEDVSRWNAIIEARARLRWAMQCNAAKRR